MSECTKNGPSEDQTEKGTSLMKEFDGVFGKKISQPRGVTRVILTVILILGVLALAAFIAFSVADAGRVRYARDFGFNDVKSPNDADGDGIDDYTDMLLGALEYIATKPEYESAYYAGGYPNDGKGVCTDVIWRAFAAAGYSLKDMVDKDIAEHPDLYMLEGERPDPNIDFRRVRNLNVFFDRYAEKLTAVMYSPSDWMPGDIVIFDGHIAICSDKRNSSGIPYIIHHGNAEQGAVEANDIGKLPIKAHYRFTGLKNGQDR